MKNLLCLLLSLAFLLFHAGAQESAAPNELLYFHGKQRCAGCLAVERESRALLQSKYAKEQQDGRLSFRVIDITTDEGAALAKRYRISWSSLLLCRRQDGQENTENLTAYAFRYARKDPELFRRGLSEKLDANLKR